MRIEKRIDREKFCLTMTHKHYSRRLPPPLPCLCSNRPRTKLATPAWPSSHESPNKRKELLSCFFVGFWAFLRLIWELGASVGAPVKYVKLREWARRYLDRKDNGGLVRASISARHQRSLCSQALCRISAPDLTIYPSLLPLRILLRSIYLSSRLAAYPISSSPNI